MIDGIYHGEGVAAHSKAERNTETLRESGPSAPDVDGTALRQTDSAAPNVDRTVLWGTGPAAPNVDGAVLRGIRLVALDLDQTTLRRDKSLSRITRDALEGLIASGVHVAVASGRSFASLPDCIREIPGIEFAVTGNGAAVCRMADGARLYERRLTRESVLRILSLVEEIYPLEAFVEGVPYATAAYVRDPVAFGTPAAAISYIQSTRLPVEDMRSFMRDHADRLDAVDVVALDAVRGAPEVRERLAREVPEIYITSSAPQLIEIAHRDAGKASGAAWLAEYLGVTAAQTAAFGDAENDRDMIRWAGLGVAVANADPGTRASADLVTASNEEDGVALVLQEILASRNGSEAASAGFPAPKDEKQR